MQKNTSSPSSLTSGGNQDEVVLSLSVVSTSQGGLVRNFLNTLNAHAPPVSMEVVLTINGPEPSPLQGLDLGFPVRVIENATRRGFAQNHNAAFRAARGAHFCVINPDITFPEDVFSRLLAHLRDPRVGITAPRMVDETGHVQDSFRSLPTPGRIVARVFSRDLPEERMALDERGLASPDWIAGMFLLLRSDVYRELNGLNERYFLYFEDVDIGVRCRLAGYELVVDTGVTVGHDARRDSHRKLSYLRKHLASARKFFLSKPYRQALAAKRAGTFNRGGNSGIMGGPALV
jgi:GT2 family glycosyltransferase